MAIDERITVETPEGAQLSLSPAGPLPRALAYALDLLIRVIIYGLLAVILGVLGKAGAGLLMVMAFALEWFYPTLFEAFRNGQTPGKKAMGLVVVHANASPLSINGSLIRNLLRTADAFPMFYLLGFITTLISPRFQRLGDMAANTLVIHAHRDPPQRSRPDGTPQPPDWPLTRDDQLALLAFHERQGELSEARQAELAQLAFPELSPTQARERLTAISRYLVEGSA